MDRMIYNAMAGAKAAMQRQEVLSNNLANVGTNGFRAEMAALRAVPVLGDSASTRVYALTTTIGHDDKAGPLNRTDRNLDVAVVGKSWLAVQALDGTEAYTRAGSLNVNAEGLLVTAAGLPVLGDGGPITIPPDSRVQIGADGTVSAQGATGRPSNVGRIKLVTPEAKLQRSDDSLFRAPGGEALPADVAARLESGVLEGSNVSAVETMVGMIANARQFEQQMKLLSLSQTQGAIAAKLLSPT